MITSCLECLNHVRILEIIQFSGFTVPTLVWPPHPQSEGDKKQKDLNIPLHMHTQFFMACLAVIPVFTNTGITKLNRRLWKVLCMSAQLLLYSMLPKSRQAMQVPLLKNLLLTAAQLTSNNRQREEQCASYIIVTYLANWMHLLHCWFWQEVSGFAITGKYQQTKPNF